MSNQPPPTPNVSTPIIDLIEPLLPPALRPLFRARAEIGLEHYGVYLQAHNGRDALRDALDEFIDGPKYLYQAFVEEADMLERLVLLELFVAALQVTERVRQIRERRQQQRATTEGR